MDLFSTVITWGLLTFGATMVIIGGIGVLRLPDFFSRAQAAGLTDTIGAGAILIGMIFESGFSAPTVRLILILLFLWYTSPIAGYALTRAALSSGIRPILVDRPKKDLKAGGGGE